MFIQEMWIPLYISVLCWMKAARGAAWCSQLTPWGLSGVTAVLGGVGDQLDAGEPGVGAAAGAVCQVLALLCALEAAVAGY